MVGVIFASTILLSGVLLAQKAGCPLKSGSSCNMGAKKCDATANKCSIGGKCEAGQCKTRAQCRKSQACSRQKCMAEVKTALEQVDIAKKAVEAGDKTAALASLAKIEANLKSMQAMADKKKCRKCPFGKNAPASQPALRPAVVNATCPIMGSKIDQAKVPDNLYREFKGKGVGFCCGACPGAWDKLSDDEKQAKLDKASK